jgi:hypothetical protein
MTGESSFWARVGEEVRSVSDRTRQSARKAVQIGMIRVDLVSLRRDRSRALADLGERALTLWNSGAPHAVDSDAEALRLRSRIGSIDDLIGVKREELERLRTESGAKGTTNDPGPPIV